MNQLIANKINSQTNNKIKQRTANKLWVHCKLSLSNKHCRHKCTRCKQKIQHAANKRKKCARTGRCEELEQTYSSFWRQFWHFEHMASSDCDFSYTIVIPITTHREWGGGGGANREYMWKFLTILFSFNWRIQSVNPRWSHVQKEDNRGEVLSRCAGLENSSVATIGWSVIFQNPR